MADNNFEYLYVNENFEYKVGDYIEITLLSIDDKLIDNKKRLGLIVVNINSYGDIKKVIIVREIGFCSGLVEVLEDGNLKCPEINILKYGFVDLATENGVRRWKSLIPEINNDKNHFILSELVARKLK